MPFPILIWANLFGSITKNTRVGKYRRTCHWQVGPDTTCQLSFLHMMLNFNSFISTMVFFPNSLIKKNSIRNSTSSPFLHRNWCGNWMRKNSIFLCSLPSNNISHPTYSECSYAMLSVAVCIDCCRYPSRKSNWSTETFAWRETAENTCFLHS